MKNMDTTKGPTEPKAKKKVLTGINVRKVHNGYEVCQNFNSDGPSWYPSVDDVFTESGPALAHIEKLLGIMNAK